MVNIRGLGQVQAVTRRGAEEFMKAFPQFTGVIGGWRATGSVPDSDHPKGLAIDVMCGIEDGNRYANWFLANGARLGVTYVIHNHQWNDLRDGKGWRPYTGPSPHTDHVHISFSPTGGDPNAPTSNLGTGIADAMGNAGCLGWLFSKGTGDAGSTSSV